MTEIGRDDLEALRVMATETIRNDPEVGRAWAEAMGYDVDAVSEFATGFGTWWSLRAVRRTARVGGPLDLSEFAKLAFSAGFEMGVRAEALRRDRAELPEL